MTTPAPINIFDFDGTLTTETWPKFLAWTKKFGYNGTERNDQLEAALADYRATHTGDYLETYFGFFSDLLTDHGATLTYPEFMEGERFVTYNPGVTDFIQASQIKNYIVSGGLREFLQHLAIAPHFHGIYGTPVCHDESGLISGIGEVMTNVKKLRAIADILVKNGRQPDDCRDVFYVGDGYSDAPAMRFVHDRGGKAIFVLPASQDDLYFETNQQIYRDLNADGIIDFCCLADYRPGTDLANLLNRQASVL